MIEQSSIDELAVRIQDMDSVQAIRTLSGVFQEKVVFSTSLGHEDQVITQLVAQHKLPVEIFTLDTGRLFYETYDLLARTIMKYGVDIKTYYPNTLSVEKFVQEKGINSFYESVDNRKSCCYIRKVEPLKRALEGKKVWITGLRSEQSANRQQMKKLEWDPANQILKYNPLLDWSMDSLLLYIQENKIPYNPLHDVGFSSIGCAPCTRATSPDEDPRAGRWWWETSHKECGLHERTTITK